METTGYIALTRQGQLRRQMDVIANNLANMNTKGFKAEKMVFVEHLVRSKGGEEPFNNKVSYSRDIATRRDMAEGQLESTGNPLDLALSGEGFFVLQTEQGDIYTRNGRFQLDSTGQLVNQKGMPVLSDNNQPFFFTPEDGKVSIARDGSVSTKNGDIGKLAVVTFENMQDLRPGADSQFITEEIPTAVDEPNVIQGMLEQSNINPILEMANMINVQRSYEGVKGFLEKENERVQRMVRELAKSV